jgi:hypothetical protein
MTEDVERLAEALVHSIHGPEDAWVLDYLEQRSSDPAVISQLFNLLLSPEPVSFQAASWFRGILLRHRNSSDLVKEIIYDRSDLLLQAMNHASPDLLKQLGVLIAEFNSILGINLFPNLGVFLSQLLQDPSREKAVLTVAFDCARAGLSSSLGLIFAEYLFSRLRLTKELRDQILSIASYMACCFPDLFKEHILDAVLPQWQTEPCLREIVKIVGAVVERIPS